MTDLDAQRNARRRKILENSSKRLERITGVQQRNGSFEIEGYKPLHNGNESLTESSTLVQNLFPESSINTQLHASRIQQGNVSSSRVLKIPDTYSLLVQNRIIIVILIAIFTNILLSFLSNPYTYFLNKIFVPLLCYEVIVMISCPQESDNRTYLNLLIQGWSKGQLAHFLRYFSVVKLLMRDVLLFFFVFVCILYLKAYFLQILY